MVRDSGIFSVDPDLGICMSQHRSFSDRALTVLAIDNADALSKYYKLLLSVVRVIASVVMSRGSQNQQTIDQAKLFLSENRSLIVAIFKRQARIGAAAAENPTVDVEELVELLVLLMTMTGFIDVCEFNYVSRIEFTNITPSSRTSEIRNGHEERLSVEKVNFGHISVF